METIADILKNKKIIRRKINRPVNMNWELASEFANYVGLNTIFVLKLFKIFGKDKVLRLRSFLKDYPRNPNKSFEGLVYFFLKNPIKTA